MVFADIGQFGIELEKKNIQVMLDIAMECGRCAIDQLEMVHPDNPGLNAKDNGHLHDTLCRRGGARRSDQHEDFYRIWKAAFDRSPTGTGTLGTGICVL